MWRESDDQVPRRACIHLQRPLSQCHIAKLSNGSPNSNRYLLISVHSWFIYNRQKVETSRMSINEWTDKRMWNIHTMGFCSALERNEMLTPATAWAKLEDLAWNKQGTKRWTLQDATLMRHLELSDSQKLKGEWWLSRAKEGGKGNWSSTGTGL